MNVCDQAPLPVVLYEGKGALPLSAEMRAAVVSAFFDRGYSVNCTCNEQEVFAPISPLVAVVARFAGCHVPAELETGSGGRVFFINLAELRPAQAVERVAAIQRRPEETQAPAASEPSSPKRT